jgi:hypothetical protein
MTQKPSRLWNVLIACLVSGILAGLLNAWQCRGAESNCSIAALKYYSGDPVSLATWAHWINWLPGVVFGVLFAIAALRLEAPQRPRRVLLYGLVSAAAYLVAGLVFSAFVAYASSDEFSLIVWIWPGGFCAGLLGAAVLAVGAKALIRSPQGEVFSRVWLPAVVGGVAGVLFVFVCIQGEQQISLAFPAAFSIWQIAVGLALARRNGAATEPEVQ